jgi:phosphatidylserine/phosphatidylglycerophosphate/cardiolipin synthase-like enzyme
MNESSAKIYLSKKMIHSKMLVFDRKIVMSGSANLSIFSMNNAGELNLLIRNSKLVDDFLKIADWRKSVSMKVDKLKTLKSYNKIIAFLQELHQKLKL